MDISLVLGLLGGLALFLYGMQMMGNGLGSCRWRPFENTFWRN